MSATRPLPICRGASARNSSPMSQATPLTIDVMSAAAGRREAVTQGSGSWGVDVADFGGHVARGG